LHAFPHITFRLSEIGNDFNPNESDYWQALFILGVPFLTLGSLLFVVGIAAVVYRYFRGRRQYQYKKWHRTFFRVALVVIAFFMILGCGPGIWGSVEITRSGPYIADRVQQSADFLTDGTDAVFISKKQLQDFLNGSYPSFETALMNAEIIQNDLRDHKTPMLAMEISRNVVVILLYIAILLACLVGMLSAICLWGPPSLLMTFTLWLLFSFAWCVCGLHLSLSVGVADFCKTGDQYFINDYFNNNGSVAFVEYYMLCESPAPYQDLRNDSQNLLLYANESYYEALAKNDTGGAAEWLKVFKETQLLLTNLDTLNDCQTTSQDYAESKDKLCSDTIIGLSTIIGMFIFLGLLSLGAMPIGVAGYKQFSTVLAYSEFGSTIILIQENQTNELPAINFDD